MDMKTLNYFEALSCGSSGALDVYECKNLDDVKSYIDICNDKYMKEGYLSKPNKYNIMLVNKTRVFDNDGILINETTSKTRIEIY